MERSKRIRVVFREDDILSDTLQSDGLHRSWVLLKPGQDDTVSNVASHLINDFQLHQSCPHGLLLSISGFVLPPFESTSILKDDEIISVRKRRQIVSTEGNNTSNEAKRLKIAEKQPILLLRTEEFEKAKGGYESNDNEEEVQEKSDGSEQPNHRKRKAAEQLKGSNHICRNCEEKGKENEDPKRAPEQKKGPSRSARRKYAKRRWLKEMKKIQKLNMNCESEGLKNWKEDQAKRNKVEKGQERWKKQQGDAESKDDSQPRGLLHWMQSPHNNSFVKGKKRRQWNQNAYVNKHQNQKSDEHEQPNQNSYGPPQSIQMEVDVPDQKIQRNCVGNPIQEDNASEQQNEESDEENELVPVEIRPGHIRFEPMGKEARKAIQKSRSPLWNGITSKKQGQQWGEENRSFTTQNNVENTTKVYPEMSGNEKDKQLEAGVSLDKLPPLTSIPKDGYIIAYRILELSPSWTPELSDFRVGKIFRYDAESDKTLLTPVPEYPICSSDDSLYKEDGSLEIRFSSLIDARIFNNEGSGSGLGSGNDEDTSQIVVSCSQDQSTAAPKPELNQGKESKLPTSGNGGTDIWDQISEALNTKEQLSTETGWGKTPKKLQLVQDNRWEETTKNVIPTPKNTWGKNTWEAQTWHQSSGNKSWSYKAMRGSALGPTMTSLRSRKNS